MLSPSKNNVINIAIPYSLLVYSTLLRHSLNKPPEYGKWLVLITLTFIFNSLSIFRSLLIATVDLILKVGIYYLPQNVNEVIQNRIRYLHIERHIESFRILSITKLFYLHNFITGFILHQLRTQESQQFRLALIQSLSAKGPEIILEVEPKEKIYIHTATQCTIITEKKIQQAQILFENKMRLIDQEQKQSQSAKKQKEQIHIPQKYKLQFVQIRQQMRKSAPQVFKARQDSLLVEKQPTQLKQTQINSKNSKSDRLSQSESFKNLNQSAQFLAEDFQEEGIQINNQEDNNNKRIKQQKNKVQRKIIHRKNYSSSKEDTSLKRRNTTRQNRLRGSRSSQSRQRSESPNASSIKQKEKIVSKLDLSASLYSKMKEEKEDLEDQKQESKILVCKTQAIVQIGNARLEIYNIELYSNRELRIKTLFNSQIQRHKLISVSKSQNKYFVLHLSGTSVTQRRVKFRGQFHQFLNYLQPS